MTAAEKEQAQIQLDQMKACNLDPKPGADLARSYTNRVYRRRAQSKMLKRFPEESNFLDSFSDDGYMKIVRRLRETYPQEDRAGLVELVAFYLHQREKFDFSLEAVEVKKTLTALGVKTPVNNHPKSIFAIFKQ